jgi:hypothetical protein
MMPSPMQITLWQERLAALSDLELVETYNREVRCKGWGTSRGFYLNCLFQAIEQRSFDASLLLNESSRAGIRSFSLAFPVSLDLQNLKLIPQMNAPRP